MLEYLIGYISAVCEAIVMNPTLNLGENEENEAGVSTKAVLKRLMPKNEMVGLV